MTTVTTNLHQRTWACKSHGVFPPTSRQRVLSGMSRRDWQDVCPRVAQQQAGVLAAGPLRPAHVHLLLTMPPQHRVASLVGLLNGHSSRGIAQHSANTPRHCAGQQCWARGALVSTVGGHEQVGRASSEHQAKVARRLDDLLNRASVPLTASSGSKTNSHYLMTNGACSS